MTKTLNLLLDLIAFDSSTKERANDTIQYCYDWLKEASLHPEILSNNGYQMLVCNVGKGDKKLILNGHVDVVSGKASQFSPEIKDGKVYGRGTADMKAGVSAMMVALTELQESALNETTVQLQLMSDEEIGGYNCAAYLTEQGYLGDFVICAEPTQLGIGFQAKGILQIDIELRGTSAHSSRPWEGENAVVKAFELYQQLISLPFAKESTDVYDQPSINLAKINAGDVYNKVPDICRISFDIRYLPTQNKEQIIKEIESIMDGHIDIHLEGAAVQNDVDDVYIQKLIKHIKQMTGESSVDIFGQHGYADTRYFSRYHVPAIEFGPSGGAWHGDGEYADIESIEFFKDTLVSFAKRFND